jgi:hypothetical protein
VTARTKSFATYELAAAYMKKLMQEEAEENCEDFDEEDGDKEDEESEALEEDEPNKSYWKECMGSYNSSVLDAQESYRTRILLIEVVVHGSV